MNFDLYRPLDGHPDFDNCLAEATDLAAELRPLIRQDHELGAADRIGDVLRKAKSMKKLAENYIINSRRFRKGDHALRPTYAIWTMLNACNFRCTYCDNHQGEHYFDIDDPGRLDTDQGKRLLEVIATGTLAIYWCGGEPTMRDDLPALLGYAWELGFFPNMINTNGSLLHKRLKQPAWKNFLRQMDTIIVSLDGLHLDRLNGLWGVKKARQVMVNLLMLRELAKTTDFKLVVNTVITPDSIEEAGSVLDLACDLGIWFVPVPVNFKHAPNRELLENPGYVELAGRILERKRRGMRIIGSTRLLKGLLFAEPYTCFTALKPHVWSNGHICWPCRASANVEPVDIDLLDYDTFDAAYAAGRELVNPDFFHGPAKNRCGGECVWMQNYTTARYMDGIRHPLTSGLPGEIFEFAWRSR